MIMGRRPSRVGLLSLQAAIASVLLLGSGIAAFALWQDVTSGVPLFRDPGRIFVMATAQKSSSVVHVNLTLSGALSPTDPSYGAMRIGLQPELQDRTAFTKVLMLFCGGVSSIDQLQVGFPDAGDVPPPKKVAVPQPFSNAVADGYELSKCTAVDLPGLAGGARALFAKVPSGWGVVAGDSVLYKAPTVFPLFGSGTNPLSGVVGFDNLPVDLQVAYTLPPPNETGVGWEWAGSPSARTHYALSGNLKSETANIQRANILLGLSLGFFTTAVVWLAEIGAAALHGRLRAVEGSVQDPRLIATDSDDARDPLLPGSDV